MRRMLATANPIKAAAAAATTTTTATRQQQQQAQPHEHSHSHSHGGGHHHHSHASIEKEIAGNNLRQCQMVTLAGGATNVFFCITKIWFGTAGGSVALVADGFHALTDIVADTVSYVSISLSKKKLPRCRYPFGIGRLETSGAVFVAAILLIGGILLLIQSFKSCMGDLGHLISASAAAAGFALSSAPTAAAVAAAAGVACDHDDHDDHHGHSHAPAAATAVAAASSSNHDHSHGGGAAHGHTHFEVMEYDPNTGRQVVIWTMVILAASSVVCKELLFHWTRRVGKRAGSRVVVANAYHHRADAWSGAVALVGVAGQLVGIPGIDGIAGLVVSLSICKIGYALFRDSVLEFFDFQNADEVAQVRERLQDFHLRVRTGGAVTAERNTSGSRNASDTETESNNNTGLEDDGLQDSKIRFVNLFLMRHGHSYALHVQLLVHVSQTASQIAEATEEIQRLAKESLPIPESFISLLVCSPETMPRAEYRTRLYEANFGGGKKATTTTEGEKEEKQGTGCSHGSSDSEEIDKDPEMFVAAQGELVNPSLEKCLQSVATFHGFTRPIRYSWEDRTVTTPSESSCECGRDVESVAKIFRCRLIEDAGVDSEPGHGHSHGYGDAAKKAQ